MSHAIQRAVPRVWVDRPDRILGRHRSLLALVVGVTVSFLLTACGGGGGGSPSDGGFRTPLPTLSTDTLPSGPRVDLQGRDYFPATVGDRWEYGVGLGTQTAADGTLSRTVTAVQADGSVAITETYLGSSDTAIRYRRTAEGIIVSPLTGAAPLAVQNLVGPLLQYPEPFYAVGRERVAVRQGSWGDDLDGDGRAESFRFEFRQTLTSLGTLTVAGRPLADVAHFRNVSTLMVQPSDLRETSYTVTTVENAWWAPGIGLVRYDFRADGSDGEVVVSPYSLLLTGGVVAGQTLFAPQPDGVTNKIALVHNDVVYDALRGVYYASVPGNVAGNGNRIAIIDATTAAVSYSASAVGSEPGELAVSADGRALYVALNGAGQLLKLELPGMTEQWRMALPSDGFFGQFDVENMVASPVEADAVAVSLAARNTNPRHMGVALVRSGVLQSRTTPGHTGSNQIAFDGSGAYLYGYNNESTEFGLRRIAVLVDGLEEEQPVVATNSSFAPQSLDWAAGRVVVGRQAYQTPGLSLAGTAPPLGGLCIWIGGGAKLVCSTEAPIMSPVNPSLQVVDASTWTVGATLVYQRGYGAGYLRQIVAGPSGTVALSMDEIGSGVGKKADRLWLFKNAALE